MMIIPRSEFQQDTLSGNLFVNHSPEHKNSDSSSGIVFISGKDSLKNKFISLNKNSLSDQPDSTSVCIRNSISDVTFWDPNNVVLKIEPKSFKQFPHSYTEIIIQKRIAERTFLLKQLKAGNVLPENQYPPDWITILIIVTAFMYSLVKATSKGMMPDFAKFFSPRGLNDPGSRDIGGLFHWQSTILNLSSFFIIGLFACLAAYRFGLIPYGSNDIIVWLISLAVISSAVTIRHFTCVLTGIASEEKEVFSSYLIGIYQTYRFGALFLFVMIVLMLYTVILPDVYYILSGIAIFGLLYFLRIVRLLIFFLNRNISIFYLILYLCALEFLPVLIVVKYFTGLV